MPNLRARRDTTTSWDRLHISRRRLCSMLANDSVRQSWIQTNMLPRRCLLKRRVLACEERDFSVLLKCIFCHIYIHIETLYNGINARHTLEAIDWLRLARGGDCTMSSSINKSFHGQSSFHHGWLLTFSQSSSCFVLTKCSNKATLPSWDVILGKCTL